jgi:hypothetical protein
MRRHDSHTVARNGESAAAEATPSLSSVMPPARGNALDELRALLPRRKGGLQQAHGEVFTFGGLLKRCSTSSRTKPHGAPAVPAHLEVASWSKPWRTSAASSKN